MSKIGCVQHDCDECKKREEARPKSFAQLYADNAAGIEAERLAMIEEAKTAAMPSGEREALIKRLRKLPSIIYTTSYLDALANQAADMLAADAQKTSVTCQIYGHVVGACAECNTHAEADGASSAALITYAHRESPEGYRFQQYAKDPIPDWAVDVQPASSAVPEAQSDEGLRDIDRAYVHGWNACRETMLAAAPKPPAKSLPLTLKQIQAGYDSGPGSFADGVRFAEFSHGITGEPTSAKPETCAHTKCGANWDYVECDHCGAVKHDNAGSDWHVSLSAAKQFMKGV